MLERYTIHPEALMPYEDGNVVFYTDAQQAVERVEQQLAQLRERIRTSTQLIIAEIGASGPEDLESAIGRMVGQHTTLRGLVRTACERWRAQTNAQEGISFRMSMKELDATLPREGGM